MKELIQSVYRPQRKKKIGLNISQIYKQSETYFFSNARYALLEGLKILQAKPEQKILIPEFICCHLLAPLNILGLKILYYSLNQSLEPTAPEHWPKADYIIAVNYFGVAQNLAPFKKYCVQNQALLIEDNAHGFLSRSEEGSLLGERGDIGITSLRKVVNIANGGLLHFVRDDLKKLAKRHFIQPLLIEPSPLFNLKLVLKSMIATLGAKEILGLININRKIRKIVKGYEIPLGSEIDEYEIGEKINTCDINNFIGKLDLDFEVSRRRKLYLELGNLFSGLPVKIIFKDLPDSTSPMGFPFIFDPKDENMIMHELKKIGLEFYIWPSLPLEIRKQEQSFYNKIGCVRFLW